MSSETSSNDRHIVVLTGTRAEYGLLKSPMEHIRDHEDLVLSVVATGMHLSPRHGMTVEDIRSDGFTVDREVLMRVDGDTGAAMAKTLGVGTTSLVDTFQSLTPDIVLLLGDRDEALAGTLAAAHMNIPVAHIHGGDAMQGAVIDDSIRHAITKFAHIHFPATETSAERIRRMGEEEWRITVAGAPGLDDILAGDYDNAGNVLDRYDIASGDPLILVVQHPVTTQPDEARSQMATTLDATEAFDSTRVVIYPNSDAGGAGMIDEIEARAENDDSVRTFKSLRRREYLGLLDAADVMVGNSSSALIEAPSFDLPAVDVGPRQAGREQGANVLSVPHDVDAITDAISRGLTDTELHKAVVSGENPYDYGGAGHRIANRLASIDIDEALLRKRLTY